MQLSVILINVYNIYGYFATWPPFLPMSQNEFLSYIATWPPFSTYVTKWIFYLILPLDLLFCLCHKISCSALEWAARRKITLTKMLIFVGISNCITNFLVSKRWILSIDFSENNFRRIKSKKRKGLRKNTKYHFA